MKNTKDIPANRKHSWLEVIENSMHAVALAAADEPATALEILNTGAHKDTVLFLIQDGKLRQRAVQYAVNLCHRMECDLAVLYISSEPTPNTEASITLATLFDKILDLPASLHAAHGELPRTVRRFLDDHRNIISIVVDDITIEENSAKRRPAKRRKWWRELRCPVIFIPAN